MEHLDAMIDRLERDPGGRFRTTHGARETAFMKLALENLSAFVRHWYSPRTRGGADDDSLMVLEARNVIFLAGDYFPGRKMIVSAHNGHLARGTAQIEELDQERTFRFNETVPTGARVHRVLGDAVYSIMLMAYGGETSAWWNEPRALWAPPRDSLEDLMHRAGLEYAFVDLRGLERGPLAARAARRAGGVLRPGAGALGPGVRRRSLHQVDDADHAH